MKAPAKLTLKTDKRAAFSGILTLQVDMITSTPRSHQRLMRWPAYPILYRRPTVQPPKPSSCRHVAVYQTISLLHHQTAQHGYRNYAPGLSRSVQRVPFCHSWKSVCLGQSLHQNSRILVEVLLRGAGPPGHAVDVLRELFHSEKVQSRLQFSAHLVARSSPALSS